MDSASLIASVLKNPPIWDKRLKSYSNRNVVNKCWKKIGEEFGVEDGVLRKKWKYLRDQFTVELGKITPSRSGDPAGATYEPKWPHFKSLLFLEDVVEPRQSTGNLTCARKVIPPTSNDDIAQTKEGEEDGLDDVGGMFDGNNEKEHESYEDMCESSVVADPGQNVNSGEMSFSAETFGRKRKRNEGNSKYNETIIEIEKKKVQFLENALTNRQEEDEDMLFFRSLLPHVGIIPANMKLRFRNRIQQVVEEFAYPSSTFQSIHYSRGTFYDSSTPSPHTTDSLIWPYQVIVQAIIKTWQTV